MRFTLGRRGVAVAAGAVVASVIVSTAIAGSAQNPTYNLKKLKGDVTADGSSTVGPYTSSTAVSWPDLRPRAEPFWPAARI